ncbi:DUF2345 domain-containing protein, partial [Aquitalea palustris]
DKDLTITSAKGKQQFNGKKEILLTSGGAYVRIKDGKIELHAPGTVSFKGGSHDWSGPDSLNLPFPRFPNTVCKSCMANAFQQANPLVNAK